MLFPLWRMPWWQYTGSNPSLLQAIRTLNWILLGVTACLYAGLIFVWATSQKVTSKKLTLSPAYKACNNTKEDLVKLKADSLPSEPPGKPKNTVVGCYPLLQGMFPIHGSNPGVLHYRHILYHLRHQGSPLLSQTSVSSSLKLRW